MRGNLLERLAAIEVTYKLYHEETKSILENNHREVAALKSDLKELHWTLFGGRDKDDIGLMEQIRSYVWKAGFIVTVGFGMAGFILKLFSPSINKLATKIVGESPIQEYIQQRTRKKYQLFDRKTGAYLYFIQIPEEEIRGEQGQHRLPKKKSDEDDN